MRLPEWRRLTEEERDVLVSALYERKYWEPQYRIEYVMPDEVAATVEGLVRWTLGVLYQDNPSFLKLGMLCFLAVICYGFVQAMHWLQKLVF